MFEATQVGDPEGQGEMVQGDDGHDAAIVTSRENCTVVIKGVAGKGPVLGLDARPFD
jgi:hypothetical protein